MNSFQGSGDELRLMLRSRVLLSFFHGRSAGLEARAARLRPEVVQRSNGVCCRGSHSPVWVSWQFGGA